MIPTFIANLCWLLCFFGTNHSSDTITYTLEDGTTWTAQLGEGVLVRVTDRGKEKVYTGEVDKLHEMYVKVSGEPIFIEDIISVTVAREGEQFETEPEERIHVPQEEKEPKPIANGYVVVRLQGEVGIIPETIAGKFSTEYISADSIAEMLKKLNAYKKVQHIVFDVESTGGDSIEIAKIAPILAKYKKRYTYHAIVAKKDADPLQIAKNCYGIFVSVPFVEGGYDAVAEAFEKSNILYKSEFIKIFWKELLQSSYAIQYTKAYEFAAKKTNRLLPKESMTPKAIGIALEYVDWTAFPKKSKSSLYVIQKSKERQIKDMVIEQGELFALIQQVSDAKMRLLGVPQLKQMAEDSNPNNFTYETSVREWYDEYTERWYRTEEMTSDAKTLWNRRLDDALRIWRTITETLNATYSDPMTAFARIVRGEATSQTQREIREDAKLAIEEEFIKLSNAYKQVYPLLFAAEQNILSLQGMYK
ncbi:MAG: hypothetical protein H8E86_08335 [Planctomycetes bacterium]|nr:hypothetical protein [Planctomycetota bacterium]